MRKTFAGSAGRRPFHKGKHDIDTLSTSLVSQIATVIAAVPKASGLCQGRNRYRDSPLRGVLRWMALRLGRASITATTEPSITMREQRLLPPLSMSYDVPVGRGDRSLYLA